MLTVEQVARVCHEANRGYQAAVSSPGIPIAQSWDDFPDDQQRGVMLGVMHAVSGSTPEELHELWCLNKFADGWRYGPEKDADAKMHPCLVAYDQLPEEQRVKDRLFKSIVGALGIGAEG